MKKTLLIALLAITATLGCVLGLTACNKGELEYTLNSDNASYTVSGIGTYSTTKNKIKIIVPELYNGLPVTAIGEGAFRDKFSTIGLENSVIIGSNVTEIGGFAFYGCKGLSKITIGDNVTSIGTYSFYDCRSLKNITIPDGVTSIGNYAFNQCINLEISAIPDSVTYIGSSAFSGCKLTYNEYQNAQYLGNNNNPYLFLAKANSTDILSCTIHQNTKAILNRAFMNCKGLTNIAIPSKVTYIGDDAFNECIGLTSIYLPGSVTAIESSAFDNCTYLTSINFSGAAEHWKAIKKGNDWNKGTGNYTVHCTDGNLSKSES